MALDKNDAIPSAYTHGGMPSADPNSLRLHVNDEFRKIQRSLARGATIVPQVADREPSDLYVGMIRYTKSADWDPLALGVDAWIYWDGSAWQELSGTGGSGDVVGPASATDGNFPLFDTGTGKLLKNSIYSPASFADASHTHAQSDITDLVTDLGNKANSDGTNFVIENRTSDPGAPATGQIWLRTDL